MRGYKPLYSFAFILSFFFVFSTSIASASTATTGQIIISEFRVRGPNGMNDEFIELYNASGADHTVDAASGSGYGVVASDGITRCSIPNGTVIPARGHYLCVNSIGYSLASYPGGNGTTATGDATYTTDIPDNSGIALFNNNSGGASYMLANRLDAVGTTSTANTLYKEGVGVPALVPFSIDYSLVRDECGKGGSITTLTTCTYNGLKDSNNNTADFIFVDTNGTSAGAGQRLGSPGPQNLGAPISSPRTSPAFTIAPLDTCPTASDVPNRVRDYTSNPPQNSSFGTLDLRYRITNNTGGNVTRLRLRMVDLTTFPAPGGIADLRPRTSSDVVVNIDGAPCGSGSSNVTVRGTTLEQAPAQPNGGGYNSTMSVNQVTLASPLANGAAVDVRVLLGIQQTGSFKVGFYAESLPSGGAMYYVTGQTDNVNIGKDTPVDFDGDGNTDISTYRPSNGQWWYKKSFDGQIIGGTFGTSTDVPLAGDYTGDGKADRVLFRPSTGQWFVLRSEDGTFYAVPFGLSTDIPVVGDFDNDGKADHAVFRASTGLWYIRRSSNGSTMIIDWGLPGDKPVPADYDGDNITDAAIFRPSNGQWWISYSGGGDFSTTFGHSNDQPVAGDYTGDGRADIAVWDPTGSWYVLRSENNSYYAFNFGSAGDVPSPGDYDGDGKFDACVFRPSTTQWFTWYSGAGSVAIQLFGSPADVSIPNSFVP